MTETEAFAANVSIIALVLSVLGFVIAGYSLGWQIYKHFKWAKPALVVSGTWSLMQEGTRNARRFWELEVAVANIGDLETQIENVYWEFEEQESKSIAYRVRGSWHHELRGIMFDGAVTTYDGELEPQIPVPIPPYSSRRWMFRRPIEGPGHGEELDKVGRGRAAVEWVSRAKIEAKMGENPHIVTTYGPWATYDTTSPDSGWVQG